MDLVTENKCAAFRSLEEGYGTNHFITNIIPCNEVVNQLMLTLTPSADPTGYRIIVGENGTGKTSLIQLILHKLNKPKGTLFVDYSLVTSQNLKEFTAAFKKVIDYKHTGNEKDPELITLLNCFRDAAIQFREVPERSRF